MTYLAVPIAAKNLRLAAGQVKAALAGGAEMLELRSDYLDDLNSTIVAQLIAETKSAAAGIPVIVTCRDGTQGGANDWPLELRSDVLESAVAGGADFIDCEWDTYLNTQANAKLDTAVADNPGTRLILSAHSFEGPFERGIESVLNEIRLQRADIIKLVYTANHINDCFEAFDVLHNGRGDLIVFCMGAAGMISRIIAKKLGGFLTFASVDAATATAPGQLTIKELKDVYRWDAINRDTELYGVIGSPVAHSLSPAIHNACFADAKLNKLYLPLLVQGGRDDFYEFMDNCLTRDWLGLLGFSVTIPHKQNALSYVKQKGGFVEPLAEKIGAVNTVVFEPRATSDERRITAYNTDYAGALDAISSALGIRQSGLKELPVAVVGAGGVARAIVAGLSDIGARIKIYNRTVAKAEKLAAEFGCDYAGLKEVPGLDAKLLINCTSIGMYPNINETPVPQDLLKKDLAVFDTVYNPAETLLLKQAKAAGARTISGLDMFINQAAAQFKLFTGRSPDVEFMRKTILTYLQK